MKRALLMLSVLAAGCVADESANPNLDRCTSDADCAGRTCYRGFCVGGGDMDAGTDAGMQCPTERVCYEGGDATSGKGECATGCLAADGVTCEGQVLPTAEECNQIDDDCDDRIDEEFDLSGADGCGVCGRGCASGETCCADGEGGFECANFDTSSDHCMACGTRCSVGQACCGAAGCADVRMDELNCGGCGIECPSGRECCDGRCVDPDYSNDHCGGCGVATCEGSATSTCCPSNTNPAPACRAETDCVSCPAPCASGQRCCGGACIGVTMDPLNCGGCGVACGADERCCGGSCLHIDDACGACGTSCGATEQCCGDGAPTCISRLEPTNCGGCGVTCDPDEECCASGCASLRTDPMNCGTCGMMCRANEVCTNRNCCPTGQMFCDGACRDVSSDEDYCGNCTTQCGLLAPNCNDGSCGL